MAIHTGPIPTTFQIAPRDVQALIHDLEVQKKGYQLYYAVDASEVIDYCFPLKLDSLGETDIDVVSQDQTALDELFTKRSLRPLLIPHYVGELTRYFTFVRANSARAYEDIEICRRMMDHAGDPAEFQKLELTEDKLNRLGENFVRMLAVWMGIFSIGTERFQQVLSRSLLRLGELEGGRMMAVANEYRPKHADRIYNYLKDGAEQHGDQRKLPQRLHAAQTDAGAIDWLIYINDRCAELAQNGGPKCLFLYMSSAPKTRRIFELPWIRECLPIVEQERFAFWRTRHQLLVQAAAMRNAAGDIPQIIDNLKQIYRLAQMVSEAQRQLENKPHGQCDQCIQKGDTGSTECIWKDACRQLHAIRQANDEMSNLGLVARIRSYQDLLKSRPKVREQRNFMEVLQDLVKNGELPDAAMRRIEDMQSFALTQSVLVREYLQPVRGTVESIDSEILPEPLRLMPYTFPAFSHPTYSALAEVVYKYSQLALSHLDERRELVRRAMQEFLEIDRTIPYPGGEEHELMRLLLFLCFGGPTGYADALDRSRKLVTVYPERKFELKMAAIIAAQQLERFIDVRDLIEEAIALDPKAGLLYHRRSINTFEWNDHERMRKFFAPPLRSCIDDCRTALDLFRAVPNRSLPLEAAVLNNSCFFQCYKTQPPFDQIFDLKAARAAFLELCSVLEHSPQLRFAEFLHTGAHLALEEAKAEMPGWEGRLNDGLQLIVEAQQSKPCRSYAELQEFISNRLKRVVNMS